MDSLDANPPIQSQEECLEEIFPTFHPITICAPHKENSADFHFTLWQSPQNKASIFPKSPTMKVTLMQRIYEMDPDQKQRPHQQPNYSGNDIWKALRQQLYPDQISH